MAVTPNVTVRTEPTGLERPPGLLGAADVGLAGAAILMASGLPTRVRFEASRSAFDQLATDVMAGGSTDVQSVGLYDIELLEQTPDGVRFLVLGSGFIDVTGFAFSTDGDPSDSNSEDVYRPLGGGWYQWTRVF